MKSARRWGTHGAILALTATLAACGGGGSSSGGFGALGTGTSGTGSGTSSGGNTVTALSLSGTAATGAALSGATVSATCASGSGSATTSSSGTYGLSVSNGSLPCVLSATSADGNTVLHSVAAGTGSGTATSNITPLSELLVAQLSGMDPASYVAQFNGSTTISSDAVATAQGALLQTLAAAAPGVDFSTVTDILSGSLSANSGTGYDGVLDKLQASITAAGTSLGELSTTVATSSGAGSATGATTLSTVLAVASSDCAALKSGSHRLIDLATHTNQLITIDASAMTATVGGSPYTLSKNSSCDYTLNDSTSTRVLVAKSGIATWVKGSGVNAFAISLPSQTLDMASLGGVYNRSSFSGTGTAPQFGEFGTVTFNTVGVNTVSTNCPTGYGSCVVDPSPQGHLTVNGAGGFDYIDDGQGGIVGARVFGFRNSSGNTVLVAQESGGTLSIFSAQAALPLPTIGTVNAYWFVTLSGTGTGPVTTESNTVTAVDTATGKVTRQLTAAVPGGVAHTDVISFNDPYPGMRYRLGSNCVPAGSCGTAVQVPLPGTGIVINVSSAKHNMTLSINKP